MEADSSSHVEMQDGSKSWSYVPRRRRILPGDAFFDDGNLEISLTHKQMPVEAVDEEECNTRREDFKCHIVGCNQTFTTTQSYEIHYNGAHWNICRYCRRSYPSNHLLDIHILESHDSLFALMAQKQPMYQCLVESCLEKFPNSQNRREHLIKHHHYPADFRFQRGLSKPRPKGMPKATMNTSENAMDTEATTSSDVHSDGHDDTPPATHGDTSPATHGDKPQTACVGHQPAAERRQHRVPVNISFGRGGARSFQRGHQKQQNTQKKHKGHTHKQKGHSPKEEPMGALLVDENKRSRKDVMNINDGTEQEPMNISNEYS